MNLTPEQQAILNGEKGEVLAKVMKTLVMYGDAFGAEKLVPVTSKYGHTVISFGINTMKPVYDLYDQLLASGADFQQKFTADPLPLDPNVPSNLLQDLVFKQFMYKLQPRYEEQLRRMGMKDEKDFRRGLKSASGWLRHELAGAMNLRYTPELVFEIDHSIEYGAHISRMIEQLGKKHDGDENDEL